jgi:hypothetical protein
MDRFLLIVTIFNYVGGIAIEKYFLQSNNYNGAAIIIFPFLWFGFIMVILRTRAAISHETDTSHHSGNEKFLPNIILLILNALFPIVGLILLGSK